MAKQKRKKKPYKPTIGDWIADWQKCRTLRNMSHVDGNTVNFYPRDSVQRAFANALSDKLTESGFVTTVK